MNVLYKYPDFIKSIRISRFKWAGHVKRMQEKRNSEASTRSRIKEELDDL